MRRGSTFMLLSLSRGLQVPVGRVHGRLLACAESIASGCGERWRGETPHRAEACRSSLMAAQYITPHGLQHDNPIIIFLKNRFLVNWTMRQHQRFTVARGALGLALLTRGHQTEWSEFFFPLKITMQRVNRLFHYSVWEVGVGRLEDRIRHCVEADGWWRWQQNPRLLLHSHKGLVLWKGWGLYFDSLMEYTHFLLIF